MINDFKKEHYYSIYDERPLIKNISYVMDTGQYILLDNKGNNYYCDIFGREQPQFRRNISGFINGEQRKKLNKVKSVPNIKNSSYSKKNNDNTKKEDSKSYFPTLNKFEGYAPFPRPLCPPFTNIPESILDDNYKRTLINNFGNKLTVGTNKKIFAKKNANNGLTYLTSNVKSYLDYERAKNNDDDDDKKGYDKSFLINMIDNTVDDYKIKYNCDLKELLCNHSMIRSLLHLKKNLINNDQTNLINGRKLKNPNSVIVENYKVIDTQLNDYYKQVKAKNNQKRMLKCYSQIDMKNSNKNDNKYIKKLLKKISFNKSTNNSKETNSILNKKDNKKEKINKILYKYMNKSNNILNESKDKDDKENKISNDSEIINDNNRNQNKYEDQETKETLGNKCSNNAINNCNTNESDKEDNLSVISLLNEKENRKFIQFNKKIKYLKALKKLSEKERKYLIGYKKEEPKKPKILSMNEEEAPKYKDFAEIYKKEQETLEKCNPIIYNIQKKKEEKDLKKMKKKKEFKLLNEIIIMKGKKLKINRSFSKK